MKILLKLSKEALRYKTLYIVSILATFSLTGVNLAAPKVLSALTGIVERGVTVEGLSSIGYLTIILISLYLARIASVTCSGAMVSFLLRGLAVVRLV